MKFLTNKFINRNIIFVSVFILIALIYNFHSPNGISVITEVRTITMQEDIVEIPLFTAKNEIVEKSENIFRITKIDLDKAKEMFHQTSPIFLDARSVDDYKRGHIPGALNIPVDEIDLYAVDFFQFESTQKFVCYCTDERCDLALQLATILEENGFMNIYYFADGWKTWIDNGNQFSVGEKP